MPNYITIVIRMPEDEEGKKKFAEGKDLLGPFITAMSLEDEMTLLEQVEGHEDFDPEIMAEARSRVKDIHAAAEHLFRDSRA